MCPKADSGDAGTVGPLQRRAGVLGGCVERRDLAAAEAAVDPIRAAVVAQNDGPAVVDDLNDAAGRKILDLKRVLKMLDLDADAEHRRQLSVRVLETAGNRGHPIAGGAPAHWIADHDALPAGQDPVEIIAVPDIGAPAFGRCERGPHIAPIGRRQQQVADVIGCLGLGTAQHRVVGLHVACINRDGLAQAHQKVVEISDLVVDPGGHQAGFGQRASECLDLVASPLNPEATADQGHEWNDRGNHQTQKPRSNAAEHGGNRPSLSAADDRRARRSASVKSIVS